MHFIVWFKECKLCFSLTVKDILSQTNQQVLRNNLYVSTRKSKEATYFFGCKY